MRKLLLLNTLFYLVILSNSIHGQDSEEVNPVKKLTSQFAIEIGNLNKPLDDLNTNYRQYLENQRAVYQKAGSLKAVLAVDEELNRFENSNDNQFSNFPELKRLQRIYRTQRTAHTEKTEPAKLQLIQSFKATAAEIARDLTRQGKIEDAKLAMAEVERFKTLAKNTGSKYGDHEPLRARVHFVAKCDVEVYINRKELR